MRTVLRLGVLGAALTGLVAGLPGNAEAGKETHTALIGKRAPEIEPDFAVNGEPTRLADLKGKVVLVVFVDFREGPSKQVMTPLQEWYKDFKDQGLEILAVTWYNCEFKRHLPGVGKDGIANPKDEQDWLREYARAHDLKFRLMKLPMSEAQRAFKEYGVTHAPQFVLINSKGVVEFIRVGGDEKPRAAVEARFKKLLDK